MNDIKRKINEEDFEKTQKAIASLSPHEVDQLNRQISNNLDDPEWLSYHKIQLSELPKQIRLVRHYTFKEKGYNQLTE